WRRTAPTSANHRSLPGGADAAGAPPCLVRLTERQLPSARRVRRRLRRLLRPANPGRRARLSPSPTVQAAADLVLRRDRLRERRRAVRRLRRDSQLLPRPGPGAVSGDLSRAAGWTFGGDLLADRSSQQGRLDQIFELPDSPVGMVRQVAAYIEQ